MLAKLPQAYYHAGIISKEDVAFLDPLVDEYLEALNYHNSVEAQNVSGLVFILI